MNSLTDFQLGLIVIGLALLFAGLVLWALVRLIRRLLPTPVRRKACDSFDAWVSERPRWIDDDLVIINPSTGSVMPPGGFDSGGHLYGEPANIDPFHRYHK